MGDKLGMKVKEFFKEWWGLFVILFVIFLIIVIAIFSIYKLGHFIDLKELHSYDYVSIDGVIYNTEDIDDISYFAKNGRTFYIKGTTRTICTTQYTYFNKEDLDKYLRVEKIPEIKEKEILID